jgi:hypothetical protein
MKKRIEITPEYEKDKKLTCRKIYDDAEYSKVFDERKEGEQIYPIVIKVHYKHGTYEKRGWAVGK